MLLALLPVAAPVVNTQQRSDGRCLVGETQPTEAANTDTSDSNAARILDLAAAAVPALSGVAVEGMQVGYRPYPADGLPVLGWVPGCSNAYVAGAVCLVSVGFAQLLLDACKQDES